MRAVKFTIAAVVGLCVVSLAIWSVRYAPWIEQRQHPETRIEHRLREDKVAKKINAGQVPEIAFEKQPDAKNDVDHQLETAPQPATGPNLPKVSVTSSTSFPFGVMSVGEERRHTFRIENKGDATLVLAKGPTECKCAVSRLAKHEVPPGDFAEVEVRWRPTTPDEEFQKSAIIWSNDPKWPLVRFTIEGRVPPLAVVYPSTWNAGTITDEHDGKAVGRIASEVVDKFDIQSIMCSDPNVHIDFKPITKESLKKDHYRCGYEFTATVGKGVHLGDWRALVRIETTLKDSKPIDAQLTARRKGPIVFLPAIAIVGEALWNNEKQLLNLGQFKSEAGSKAAVPAFVGGMKEPFRILDVNSSEPFVKVSLERDPGPAPGSQQGVRFVFEVPPGAPPVTRLVKDPIRITVKTNHPTIHKIDFALAFVAS